MKVVIAILYLIAATCAAPIMSPNAHAARAATRYRSAGSRSTVGC
jgi:hypothetical protein